MTVSGVKRQPDAAGENIAVFTLTLGANTYKIQAIALTDPDTGDALGVVGNPIITQADPSSPVPVGGATEAKQDDQITELQNMVQQLLIQNSLIPQAFDRVDLVYTGDKVTEVQYKDSGGSLLSSLALTYSGPGGKISRIERI